LKPSCITTYTGLSFDYLEPGPFRLEDIANALAKINRFNGHTVLPYSVAEHSVLVAKLAENAGEEHQVQLAALMHDAHEAYIGDFARPQKVAFPELREVEEKILVSFRKTVTPTLTAEHYERTKPYDDLAVHLEAFKLFQSVPEWVDRELVKGVPWELQPGPIHWQSARDEFLYHAHSLALVQHPLTK